MIDRKVLALRGNQVTAFPIPMSQIVRCPIRSPAPRHYRKDGSCKCSETFKALPRDEQLLVRSIEQSLVDLEAFASIAELSIPTLRVMKGRRQLPEPVVYFGRTPVWTTGQVRRFVEARSRRS